MSSIPVSDIILTIGKVGVEVGQDLLPLFQRHEPRLRTEPLPPADEEMYDAAADAKRRLGGYIASTKRDTDPAMPAVRPEEDDGG